MRDGALQFASRPDVVGALRKTAATTLIAVGLLLPLIGFDTVVNIRNELVLQTRWLLLLAIVALIAVFRFLQLTVIGPWVADLSRPGELELPPDARALLARWGKPVVLAFVIVYPIL